MLSTSSKNNFSFLCLINLIHLISWSIWTLDRNSLIGLISRSLVAVCPKLLTLHAWEQVHVYAARNLPAADADGTADPYVVVRTCGQKRKTIIRRDTLNPEFYQTLLFDIDILPVHLAPQVVIEVWDWDRFSPNERMGTIRLPMSSHFVLHRDNLQDPAKLAKPTWLPLATSGAMSTAVRVCAAHGLFCSILVPVALFTYPCYSTYAVAVTLIVRT